MSIYDDLQKTAGSLLNQFNQGVLSLVQITDAPGGTPDEPAGKIETVYNLKGVVAGISFKYRQQSFTTDSDLMVTVGVLENVTPSIQDFIEIDGTRYKIVQDVSTPASGTKCVWKFIVRK